jgi:hypothetical protein
MPDVENNELVGFSVDSVIVEIAVFARHQLAYACGLLLSARGCKI